MDDQMDFDAASGERTDAASGERTEDEINEDICRNYHARESFSEEANSSVEPSKEILRERIVDYIGRVGDATCDEAEQALSMPHQTASARFSELKRAARIVPLLDQQWKRVRRLTRHGRWAGVYRVPRAPKKETP